MGIKDKFIGVIEKRQRVRLAEAEAWAEEARHTAQLTWEEREYARQKEFAEYRESLAMYGGRIALVADYSEGDDEALREISATVVTTLAGRGFAQAERICVESLIYYDDKKGDRYHQAEERLGRVSNFLTEALGTEFPDLEEVKGISESAHPFTHSGDIRSMLKTQLDNWRELNPGYIMLGYIGLIEGRELIGMDIQAGPGVPEIQRRRVFESVRQGGVIVPASEDLRHWVQILPGNQLDAA